MSKILRGSPVLIGFEVMFKLALTLDVSLDELVKDGNEDYEVVILEETEEIGGISRTVRYNGNRMDIGGHRFFSKDSRVMDFWEELMPIQGENSFDDEKLGRVKPLKEGGPNPEKEDTVMLVRNRVSRIYYLKNFEKLQIRLMLVLVKWV